MKAYIVQDDYGDSGACVRFAKHNVVARREGALEINCEFDGVTCKRYPAFDQYAEQGDVPAEVLVEHGWFFECMRCSQQVCSNPVDENYDDIELHPIYEGHRVWCSQDCKDKFAAERAAEKQREADVAAAAIKEWPGITVRHTNGYEQPSRVWFEFPGGQDQVWWRQGEKTVWVSVRDKEAWLAFTDGLKRQRASSTEETSHANR